MTQANIKSLLDEAKSTLLSIPKIARELEQLKIEAVQTGLSHEIFNSARIIDASEIIAGAEACLALKAAREARASAYNAPGKSIAPFATPRAALVEKKVRKPEPNPYAPRKGEPVPLPPLKKAAPKATAPQPPATPHLDAAAKLKGFARQNYIKSHVKEIAAEQGRVRRYNDDKSQKYNKFSKRY